SQAGVLVVGAERAAQRTFDTFRNLGKGHFAIERSEYGPTDQGRAAQTCQDGAAEPLHGDAAAVDDSGLGTIDRKRRLVPEIDDPGFTPVAAPACRRVVQTTVPPIPINTPRISLLN